MMNSGFNGTGTAFIFYIALAAGMPLVQLYRRLRRRSLFADRFVAGHFALGLTVTLVAVICVGLVWHRIQTVTHGELHTALTATAWVALGTVLLWVTIPRFVRLAYFITGRRRLLDWKNEHIHPWRTPADVARPARTVSASQRRQQIIDISRGPRRQFV